MSTPEKDSLVRIEQYILDLEKDMSELIRDNVGFKRRLETLDKVEKDIRILFVEVESINKNTLSLSAFDALIDSFQNRMDELREIRQIVRRHETYFKTYEDKFDGIYSRLDSFQEQLSILFQKVGSLEKGIVNLGLRIDVVEQKIDAVEVRLESVEQKIDAVEVRLESVEQKIDAVEVRLESVEQKIDAVEVRLDSLETKVDALGETMVNGFDKIMQEIQKLQK